MERNLPFRDSLFDYTVPSDYEVMLAESTSPWQLSEGMTGGNAEVKLQIHHLFALADSSLLVCWSSKLTDKENNQALYFQGRHPGDDFPDLPVVVYGLEQLEKDKNYAIPGHYLAHTIKDHIAYVWGIYSAPDRPQVSGFTPIQILHQTHMSGEDLDATLILNIHINILDERDFQQIVLTAMAELSDDQQAPELSYETMIALTQ